MNKLSFLASLFAGWGIKESWAKLLAGAIIGALSAAGFLSSCSTALTQSADGSWSYYGTIVSPVPVDSSK